MGCPGPGCWASGEGRKTNRGNVDYSVAVPYAWYSDKGTTLQSHAVAPGPKCQTNQDCLSARKLLCINKKCWGGVPGNCNKPADALTIRCSGGGGSACNSDNDCSDSADDSPIPGTCIAGKCASQFGGICTKNEDCLGYVVGGNVGCGTEGTCWNSVQGMKWSGRTCDCDSCVWEVVAGEDLSANTYTQGTAMCWALAKEETTLDSVKTATDCNNVAGDKCKVVQADNVCGGNCAQCVAPGGIIAKASLDAGDKCPKWKYPDDKKRYPKLHGQNGFNECNQETCTSVDSLYATSHRCQTGEDRQKTNIPQMTAVTKVGETPLGETAKTSPDVDPDWCGGHTVHFDVRAKALPFGDSGVQTAHFRSIPCPPPSKPV